MFRQQTPCQTLLGVTMSTANETVLLSHRSAGRLRPDKLDLTFLSSTQIEDRMGTVKKVENNGWSSEEYLTGGQKHVFSCSSRVLILVPRRVARIVISGVPISTPARQRSSMNKTSAWRGWQTLSLIQYSFNATWERETKFTRVSGKLARLAKNIRTSTDPTVGNLTKLPTNSSGWVKIQKPADRI